MKHKFTKEELEHEYITLGLDTTQIAKKFNLTGGGIWWWLKKYNIPRRSKRAGGINLKDLTGKQFGDLTVIKQVKNSSDTNTSAKWECICKCGKTHEVVSGSLLRGLTKSCGCRLNSKMWKGYGKISSSFWSHVKVGARRRNLEFKITLKYAWELFLKQNSKCALSGVDINLVTRYSYHRHENTASIDRIDSSKGYIKDNIQWVHKRINIMKSNMSDIEFVEMCKKVVDNNKHK